MQLICRGTALIMRSYLVGNGCRHLGLFWRHFLVMGILFGHGPVESWDVSVVSRSRVHALGVCNFGHGLSFVGVTGLVMGCHL